MPSVNFGGDNVTDPGIHEGQNFHFIDLHASHFIIR
jgi:hypothetical protein